MQRYQLAKLVEWAGRLDSRKRIQKVVFMLQSAGCPMDADFFLHRYGPYSQDIAQLTDEMVRQNLLLETETPFGLGSRFSYELPTNVQIQIDSLEKTDIGKSWLSKMLPYEALAKELLSANLRNLEYASTIVFFFKQGMDWQQAVSKAQAFKQSEEVSKSLPLAQSILKQSSCEN